MNKFEVIIRVSIRPMPDNTGMIRGHGQLEISENVGQLEISENVQVEADSFLELCKILAQFDELGKSLDKSKSKTA